MKAICKDLAEEYAALDDMVKDLDDDQWNMQTPFFQWTIKDEISHLAYFDQAALLSATDAKAFAKDMEEMLEGFTDFTAMHKKVNNVGKAMSNSDLLAWWRKERAKLVAGFEALKPDTRVPWYGPTMSARSSATARIMETWAHGQDIADALKIDRPGTDRLKHIAFLGVSTFKWSFKNRELAVPEQSVRVALTSPSDELWAWGSEDSDHVVSGSALDFCLVVTQRRNPEDTGLKIRGDIAEQWIKIAQAFAGPPEDAPAPGVRV
ncbi:MAG: TIGR03084 family protein [Desulfobacteraceae bacterium]|nr:TIGR03084 family protein [Desulfobacteraceae bacterium]